MAGEDRILKILLQLQADLTGGAQIKGALGELSDKLTNIQKIDAWGNYLTGLKKAQSETESAKKSFSWEDAFKFAGAEEALRRTLDIIRELGVRMEEQIKLGVDWVAKVQVVQTQLAGVLLQTQGGQFKDFPTAFAQAGIEVDKLKDKANELGIQYADMFETFQHIQAVLSSGAGIKDFNEQLNLAVVLTRALQTAGVNSSIAFRDIADILRGQASIARVGGTAMAGLMGFASPQELDQFIQQASAIGNLSEAIMSRMGGVKATSEEMGRTFTGEVNRMFNALNDFRGNAAQPIMEPLTDAIRQFTAALKTEDVQAWARVIGGAFVSIAEGIKGGTIALKDFIEQHRIMMSMMSMMTGGGSEIARFLAGGLQSAQQAALEQIRIENLEKQTQELRNQITAGGTVQQAEATMATLSSRIAEVKREITAETNKGKDADQGVVSQLQNALNVLSQMASTFLQIWGTAVKVQDAVRGITPAAARAIEEVRDKIKLLNDEASDNKVAIAADKAKIAYDQMLKTLSEPTLKIPLEQAKVLAKQYSDAVQNAAEHTENLKEAHQDVTAFLREESAELAHLHNLQQLINANPFLGVDEKAKLTVSTIVTEISQLNEKIRQGEGLMHGGSLDPQKYAEVSKAVDELKTKVQLLQFQLQQSTFSGGLVADLTKWTNSFGTAAQQIGRTIQGTINASLQQFNQLLLTGKFNTQQLLQQVVQLGLTLIEQMILQRAMMAINSAFATGQAATTGPIVAAAWAPAATMVSIATEGQADAQAPIAVAAALAAIQGMAFAERGGLVTGPTMTMMGESGPEYVFSAPAVRNIGVENLEAAHSAARGMGTGGITSTSSPGGRGQPIHNTAVFFDRSQMLAWLKDRDGVKTIIDAVRNEKIQLGI